MHVCVLQYAYRECDGLEEIAGFEGLDGLPDPGRFIDQHTYEHRMIGKANSKEQIDAAIAENFDFYFNFMWGLIGEGAAGAEIVEYLESRNVPFIGLRSHMLRRSKQDFYKAARAQRDQTVPVPDDDPSSFPVIVKPAYGWASQFISSKSLCFTSEERDAAIVELDRQLQPGRQRSAESRHTVTKPHIQAQPVSSKNPPSDIVVQEFVDGIDYNAVVIEIGTTPVALNPTVYSYPPRSDAENEFRFLTFELKIQPGLSQTQLNRDSDPVLFDTLQKLAVEAFKVNKMAGGSWADVDIRVKPNGEFVVIEVNVMPAIFMPLEYQIQDDVVRDSLPGGHRALLNIVLASYFMQTGEQERQRKAFIESEHNKLTSRFDEMLLSSPSHQQLLSHIVARFDFNGSVLDIGCGSGNFGRLIRRKQEQEQEQERRGSKKSSNANHTSTKKSSTNNSIETDAYISKVVTNIILDDLRAHHTGIDISTEAGRVCKQFSGYDEVLIGPMQTVLSSLVEASATPSQPSFDHVTSYHAIQFVSTYEVSLVLSLCFLLARKSVTFGVDEIPDMHSEKKCAETSPGDMVPSFNHLQEFKAFGVPKGWELRTEERALAWKSLSIGADVYTTTFRFERI